MATVRVSVFPRTARQEEGKMMHIDVGDRLDTFLGNALKILNLPFCVGETRAVMRTDDVSLDDVKFLEKDDHVVILGPGETYQADTKDDKENIIPIGSVGAADMKIEPSEDIIEVDGFAFLKRVQSSRAQIWTVQKGGKILLFKGADIFNQKKLLSYVQHEVLIYKHLHKYQGRYLPSVRWTGTLAGVLFGFAMDYLNCPNLSKSGSFSKEERSIIKKRAMRALNAIHSCGILHGDIRPENILVSKTRKSFRVYFIDFEFAQCLPVESSKFSKEKEHLLSLFTED